MTVTVPNYCYTVMNIHNAITSLTTIEEFLYLNDNIPNVHIEEHNKEILLTMLALKFCMLTKNEIEKISTTKRSCKSNPNRNTRAIINEEGLMKSELIKLFKICPHCKKNFRTDKESHYIENTGFRPKRIHEDCIKNYVRNKYNISNNSLYDFINKHYDFMDMEQIKG